MSVSSEKGKSLEDEVAKILKKKLGARVSRDKRSGAGSHQKMDLNDYFQDTPLDIECKNHKAIKIKEWFRQAVAGSSISRIPTVVFTSDDEVLATVRFSDLVDLLAEAQQQRVEIADLRRPVIDEGKVNGLADAILAIDKSQQHRLCRNGHIVSPGSNKCLAKKCPYSSTYKAKKEKK